MKTFLTLLLFASLSFAQTVTNGAPSLPAPTNDGTTGTQLNHTATVNVAGNAILATTSETTVPVFIVTAHAGTSGNPGFATSGIAQCFMDANESGSAMPYVVNSVITGGDCHAQATAPSAGVYVIGFLYDSTTSTGTKANVIVAPFVYGGGGGLADPGANGVVKRTALDVTTAAVSADVISLFTGCSGTEYLGADGACHAGGSSLPASATVIGSNGSSAPIAAPLSQGSVFAGNSSNLPVAQTKPVIDVRDYGVKCDGSTNDSTAMNNALAAAVAVGSRAVSASRWLCVSPAKCPR